MELCPLIPCCVTVRKSLTFSEPQPPPTLMVGFHKDPGEQGESPTRGWTTACLSSLAGLGVLEQAPPWDRGGPGALPL